MKNTLGKRLHLAPVFTRKLALIPFGSQPVWIEDDDIDLDYHIPPYRAAKARHQSAAGSAGRAAAFSLLDRNNRPLWEFYVIDGTADGTMGFYTKGTARRSTADTASR